MLFLLFFSSLLLLAGLVAPHLTAPHRSSVGLVPGESPPERTRRGTLRNMCEALWGPVLSSLSHVMVHCADPLVVSTAVDGYTSFAVAAGILGERVSCFCFVRF